MYTIFEIAPSSRHAESPDKKTAPGGSHHAAFIYDSVAALSRIALPTLILTNTGTFMYDHAQRARRLRPDFAYTELEGGTFYMCDEMPERWADAVISFLKQ